MQRQKAVKNVFELVQSDLKAKTFRTDYPVSEELRQVMVDEYIRDFMIYAIDEYYHDENLSILKELVDDLQPSKEKRQGLLDNLFWWHILYQSTRKPKLRCMDDYIAQKKHLLRVEPFISSWLKECNSAVPKFYYVGHKYNDRAFVAIDILAEETMDVVVYDPSAVPVKRGEFIAGTLLPLGGGLFFPIVDFYHFNYEAREAIACCIHHHYEKYLETSTLHEAFIHVLSVMLQIERIKSMENHNKTSSENPSI
ncbi:hypothetical protein ABES03_16630 [Neobacillus rhizosphaerae]|uniref:hypothetical protein n=1 Tax=Neobacillus rhizosphaerae TaxID=2880965 RepID=UPI003D2DC84C